VRDPFGEYAAAAVTGGTLHVARAGPPPDAAAAVVLAVHGITSSHVIWRAVARELCGDGAMCVLAPDLRGRGGSAALPRPYGLTAHVEDLLAVLDHAGASTAVLAGHSMGAHVVARLAADHPDRAAGVVLVDGGLGVTRQLAGAQEEDPEEHVDGMRGHPAFAHAWNDDVEAYVRYHGGDGAHCVACGDAVMADTFDLMIDGKTRTAAARVRAPIRLLHAPGGVFGEHGALVTQASLEWLASAQPSARAERVADVNHYTLLIGDGPGPARVAAAITDAAGVSARA
jgi:lipase